MTRIQAIRADITTLEVDAIVNAANVHLQHGGGVALAIARAGGPALQEESKRWIDEHGPLEPGAAAVTTAGNMSARIVVHVAGPVFKGGQEDERLLRQAVRAALDTAAEESCRSIALPAISTGIYGYPLSEAATAIADECQRWVTSNPATFDEILLVGHDLDAIVAFERALS